jgi:hypothetical protein
MSNTLATIQPNTAIISIPATTAAAILKSRTTRVANVWLAARFYDPKGQGYVHLTDCRNLLKVANRNSAQLATSILRDPSFNTYFRYYSPATDRLYYRSMAAVNANLDVLKVSNAIAEIDIIKASKSIATFNATLYAASLLKYQGPVSRDTLEAELGISKSAQRKWERLVKITKHFTFIEGTPEILKPFIKYDNGTPIVRKGKYEGDIQIQTANRYTPTTALPKTTGASARNVKKLNSRIRQQRSHTLSVKKVQGTWSYENVVNYYATDLLATKHRKVFYNESVLTRKTLPNQPFCVYHPEDCTTDSGHTVFYAYSTATLTPDVALRTTLGLNA